MSLPEPLGAIERVIAVVGCQRSGTTLTGQILGAHPDAILIDEGDGLYAWFAAHARGSGDAAALAGEMLAQAGEKYRTSGERFMPNVRVLVLKAPNLTYDDDLLASLAVPVTVVYPVRDPRAVAASMARLADIDFVCNQRRLIAERPAIAARYPGELAMMADDAIPAWVRRAVVWRVKSGRASDFERSGLAVSQFRYEDLVREPEAVTAHLLAACGLSASDRVANPQAVYRGHGPGGTDRTRAIDRTSLSNWSGALNEAQASAVLDAAAPLAERFGYG